MLVGILTSRTRASTTTPGIHPHQTQPAPAAVRSYSHPGSSALEQGVSRADPLPLLCSIVWHLAFRANANSSGARAAAGRTDGPE